MFGRQYVPGLAFAVALGLGGALLVSTVPAFAETVITADQTAALQASLTAAITAAKGDSAAITAAISSAVVSAVAQYGADAAGSIASAVLSICEAAGVSGDVIGAALAQAAASVSASNSAAASSIASTVATEGNSTEVAAFQSSATALGYANLASIAGTGVSAIPVAKTDGISSGVFGNPPAASSGGANAGCLNPSCTKL